MATAPTVTAVIISAFRRIGKIPEEQDVPAYLVERGLEIMNDILDEWGASRVYIPYQSLIELTLLANQELYTIGPANTNYLVGPQVIEILEGVIQDPSTPGVNYMLNTIFNEQQYFNIAFRNSTGYPNVVLLRNYNTYSELRLQPLPYTTLNAELLVKERLSEVQLGQTLSEIPAHYLLALKMQLGIYAADMFGYPMAPDYTKRLNERIKKLLSSNVGVDYSVKRDEFLNRFTVSFFNYWL